MKTGTRYINFPFICLTTTQLHFSYIACNHNSILSKPFFSLSLPISPSITMPTTTTHAHVSHLTTSFVSPATLSPNHCLTLEFGDAVWMNSTHNQSILFYKPDKGVDHISLLSNLTKSLSVVLNDYYMWAGRLAKVEDGSVVIHCNDAGVELLEAVCSDVSFELLEQSQFQQEPSFFSMLVPLGDKRLINDLSLPLLSVQLTRFSDGGVAIGVASSHVVCDGASFWTFMASWAECGRGVPISSPPVHARGILEHFRIVKEHAPEAKDGVAAVPDSGGCDLKLAEKVFHFSPEAIKKLKGLSTENGEGPYSSFECLCAHMWRRSTAARGVGGEQKLRLSILANIRRRVVPQLPDAYFGNAIFPMRVFSTAGELARDEKLASSARRIHEAIVSCNDASIKAFEKSIQNLSPGEAFEPEVDVIGTTVVNSPKFPAYELDFGFGRPASVRIARLREEGVMMLFPGREGGGSVDVTMALPTEVMQKLETDPLLLLLLT